MSARLRLLGPAELDAVQRELYAEITGGPRAASAGHFDLTDADGHLRGPFNAMLLSPALGSALQGLGAAVRYRSHLTDRTRELAILVVAQAWDSDFERHAHERVGAAAGLSPDELLALREGRDLSLTDPGEQAAWAFTRAVTSQFGALNEHQYDSARTALGERALFELSTLVGYYSALALQLRVFDVTARTS